MKTAFTSTFGAAVVCLFLLWCHNVGTISAEDSPACIEKYLVTILAPTDKESYVSIGDPIREGPELLFVTDAGIKVRVINAPIIITSLE